MIAVEGLQRKSIAVYLDKNLKPTTKEKAVYVRIVEYDKDGKRKEVFGSVKKLK